MTILVSVYLYTKHHLEKYSISVFSMGGGERNQNNSVHGKCLRLTCNTISNEKTGRQSSKFDFCPTYRELFLLYETAVVYKCAKWQHHTLNRRRGHTMNKDYLDNPLFCIYYSIVPPYNYSVPL